MEVRMINLETNLETTLRAKMYIDKLANGIDPITDQEMPQDTVLNHVRLSRCFFYVSDILRQVIENGGEVKQKAKSQKKAPFTINPDEIHKIPISSSSVYITNFCRDITAAANHADEKTFTNKILTGWLVDNDYLQVTDVGGKTQKSVTAKGKSIGIREEQRESQYGSYTAILYDTHAQQFIVDHLLNILSSSNADPDADVDAGAVGTED